MQTINLAKKTPSIFDSYQETSLEDLLGQLELEGIIQDNSYLQMGPIQASYQLEKAINDFKHPIEEFQKLRWFLEVMLLGERFDEAYDLLQVLKENHRNELDHKVHGHPRLEIRLAFFKYWWIPMALVPLYIAGKIFLTKIQSN